MDRRAAVPVRTFATLAAALAAVGLTQAARPAAARPARAQHAPARHALVTPRPPRPGPGFPAARGEPRAGMTIRLAGPARPAPRATFPLHTLTVKGVSLTGGPDTGDLVQLFNVDNTTLLDPQAGAGVFDHGVAKFSVPSGHYFAIAEFGGPGQRPGSRFVVLPQFTVTGDRSVTIRGAAADSKVTMVTPRPSEALVTGVWLLRTGRSGPPIVIELYFPGTPVWLSPTRVRPAVGTLRVAANQHLESPPGQAVPYEYTLSFTDPPGVIPPQRYLVRAADLATVHERFYQPMTSSGGWAFNGSFPGTNPNVNRQWFGFIEPAGPSLTFPGRLTEYAGGAGSGAMEWFGQYAPFGAWQSGDRRQLRAGQRLTENWGAYPLHPGANVLLTSEPNMFATTEPSAVRAGSTLSLELDPFDDNQPGHQIGTLWPVPGASLTGTYEIDQDGVKVAGGNAVTQTGPYGGFRTRAVLGARPATIRFSLDLARTSADFPLSTATTTVWTWHSAPVRGATLPPGWSCAPSTRTRDCGAEPMMTLRYGVARLALDGTAPPGRQVLRLSAGHIQPATAAAVTGASVSVSFDGGKTWHRARVTGRGGSFTATFGAPAGALVTLRASAADAADGTITETITRAYRVGT